MKSSKARAIGLLNVGVTPLWQRLHDKRCRSLLKDFQRYLEVSPLSTHLIDDDAYFRQSFADFLRGQIVDALSAIEQLRDGKYQFDGRISRATTAREREVLLLDYARELGASARNLRGDRRALRRRWFGADALRDRWHNKIAEHEQRVGFALQRLGAIVASALRDPSDASAQETWSAMRFDDLCERLFDSLCDSRLVEAALAALADCLTAMPLGDAVDAVNGASRQHIYRLALDSDESTWQQRTALELLALIAPDVLVDTLRYRFQQPADRDDLFVRAGAVSVWCAALARQPELAELSQTIVRDPSPRVRQRLAELLPQCAPAMMGELPALLDQLARDDEPAVRATTLLTIAALWSNEQCASNELQPRLLARLATEQDEFVYRVALEALIAVAPQLTGERSTAATLLAAVGDRHRNDSSIRIRRWSAQARERFLCESIDDWQQIFAALRRHLDSGTDELDLGDLPAAVSRTTFMRILATLAQRGLGLDVRFERNDRAQIDRGHRFGFRLWRWLYEWRHPSADKRQGFRHTLGRKFRGTHRAPSTIMAEVSQTKVPGEPLTVDNEDGWRPYLPLVDECLAALDQDQHVEPHRIYTSEGVTEIEPPATLKRQLFAWWRLTHRFSDYAQWRNWREDEQLAASHYVEQLEQLGFKIRYKPHPDPTTDEACLDPAVARFFPALAPFARLDELLSDFRVHALSAYENTVYELAGYVALIGGFFFGRHLALALVMRRARQRLPLVIGGWGTRGKSGTERLKAAMFSALGLSVFSKTTGCEAMFVMNRPYRELKELFIFRPYDKATIWEQHNMVRLASRLDSDVFLWECMGLSPSYIRILQRDWMRDDICTITNTFPDHEDRQGPAGINIPEVMCEFIPPGGHVVTSEEHMLPVLQAGALERGAKLTAVGWMEAGLLTRDVVDRFPYEEHPYNIALVLGLARELDIDPDYALKEMADRVVPDLGVLKTYPIARVGDRRLEFIMGMSANERFGALNNWQRTGMAEATVAAAPDVWISTLVNNRADRVPRSRVFANFLVQDISADQHVIIGSNLKGMRGYIDESRAAWGAELNFWPSGDDTPPLTVLMERARMLRVPTTVEELSNRLRALLADPAELPAGEQSAESLRAGFGTLTDDACTRSWGERFIEQFDALQVLVEELETLGSAPSIDAAAAFDKRARSQFEAWFDNKLVFVEDSHISGDDLIELIAASSPPRMRNRMMGMQNIKGTGLGFVYCWQAWEQQWRLAEQLADDDEQTFNRALDELATQPEIGVLGRQHITEVLAAARHHPAAQRESRQVQITTLSDRIKAAHAADSGDTAVQPRHSRWLDNVVDAFESILDAGDAVRRRRIADEVYRDLVSGRISEDRAIVEIKAINARQKGGWLRKKIGW